MSVVCVKIFRNTLKVTDYVTIATGNASDARYM
jgi:hypothetical protein